MTFTFRIPCFHSVTHLSLSRRAAHAVTKAPALARKLLLLVVRASIPPAVSAMDSLQGFSGLRHQGGGWDSLVGDCGRRARSLSRSAICRSEGLGLSVKTPLGYCTPPWVFAERRPGVPQESPKGSHGWRCIYSSPAGHCIRYAWPIPPHS